MENCVVHVGDDGRAGDTGTKSHTLNNNLERAQGNGVMRMLRDFALMYFIQFHQFANLTAALQHVTQLV